MNDEPIPAESEDYFSETDIEKIANEKNKEVQIMVTRVVEEKWVVRFAQQFSNFGYSCRILAWVCRFIRNCRERRNKCSEVFVTIEETNLAEKIIIKQIQESHYEEDIGLQSSAEPEPFGAKAPGPKFDPEQM